MDAPKEGQKLSVLGKVAEGKGGQPVRKVNDSQNAVSLTWFWQFGASVEDLQVAVIREEPMSLFAGRLTDHPEIYHVLQSLRHSWRRERELLGCRRDRDDGLTLKVLMNTQNGCGGAAKLLDLPAVGFDEREYLPRSISCLLGGFFHAR